MLTYPSPDDQPLTRGLVRITYRLNGTSAASPLTRALLLRALERLRRFEHPNVAPVVRHEIDCHSGEPLVFYWLEGTPLLHRTLAPEWAGWWVQIGRPVLSALAVAAERGLTHGSFSAGAIWISRTGTPVIVGLGLAAIEGLTDPDSHRKDAVAWADIALRCGNLPPAVAAALARHARRGDGELADVRTMFAELQALAGPAGSPALADGLFARQRAALALLQEIHDGSIPLAAYADLRSSASGVVLTLTEPSAIEAGERWIIQSQAGRPAVAAEIVRVVGGKVHARVRRGAVSSIPPVGTLYLDPRPGRVAFTRQRRAVVAVAHGRAVRWDLGRLLAEPATARLPDPAVPSRWGRDLDTPKRAALAAALGTKDIVLVEGPPGTGKTTFVAELIEQEMIRSTSCRVLLASQSHAAVDNVLEALRAGVGGSLRLVRVSRQGSDRISPQVADLGLQTLLKRRVAAIKRGPGPTDSGPAMTSWHERISRSPAILERAVLTRADVVATTCVGLGGVADVGGLEFDLCIIDEAGRATLPELLIPLSRSRRFVLVGDSRQLPPFVDQRISRSSLDRHGVTRAEVQQQPFVRFAAELPAACRFLLSEQHRMHPAIGHMISTCFYDGGLHSATVASADWFEVLVPRAVTWLNTASVSGRGESRHGVSFVNRVELRVIMRFLTTANWLAAAANQRIDIVVLTAYAGQRDEVARAVDRRSRELTQLDILSETVDSFQGREASVVVYSLVRANDDRRIGFLGDAPRLNVALSRARRALVIIGDHDFSMTVEDSTLRRVARYVAENPRDCEIRSADV